ncbi:MAG TPA: alpha/beta hydrolase [Propionicimonas sp.]|nr:alpha/beta hydrolase [Propionicimonas sp.]
MSAPAHGSVSRTSKASTASAAPVPVRHTGRMPRMPLRTRALAALLRRGIFPSIATMDLAAIQRSRARRLPSRAPVAWVVGRVSRDLQVSMEWFPTRDGSRRQARVYRPAGQPPQGGWPVVCYFHGGGFVLGSITQSDPICSHLASAIPAAVVSIDYRLAPEHCAPAGIDDCEDAVRWLAEGAGDLGGDPGRLAVAGDSAGATLAALVAIRLRDDRGPRLAHQALIYPATDLSQSFPSIHEHAHAPVLDKAALDAFRIHYLGDSGIPPEDPRVSPYFTADLAGLPPALIQTADLDPLRDEGLAYADRLTAAGVPVRVTNYLGTVHGFMSFPGATVVGPQARLELVTELRRHLLGD